MRIEQYISQLLYRYQCVTIPGFGSFVTEIQSARISESGTTFYPPFKKLAFNNRITNNDGLLVDFISQVEKITFEEALKKVELEVNSWTTLLDLNQPVILKNIGTFKGNGELSYLFEPTENINYLTRSFGLSSFTSPEIKREIYKKEAQAFEDKAPITLTPEKRTYPWLKYAALFVIGVGIGGYYLNQWHVSKNEKQLLLVEQAVQEKVEAKIQEATFFIEAPMKALTLTNTDTKNYNYHLVAGAFKNEENAIKALNALLDLGFDAKKISPNKHGLHPVLYGSFSNAEEAQKVLDSIRISHNKEAWMLVQELH
ncbi:SPOR domain-containing protein [Flavobacterium sp.]|uniref:HU domain-containing protein n=1 Tax=Flavobacterium sp. TaxID=239 RepID=UPI002FDA686D